MNGSFAAAEPGHDAPRAVKGQKPAATPQFLRSVNIAFYLLLISYLVAASNAPVQDCDETFNYWEPLHYLIHGYGLQTWEYSPEFSIRSWAYILIHALPVKAASLLGKSKTFEFFTLRCLLGATCAAVSTRLYSAICRSLHPRIGVFYLLIATLSPGFFYASAAFLPSSFAMTTGMLGLATFLDWQDGSKTGVEIMYFGIGAILGWPFAGALIVPFIIEDWIVALTARSMIPTVKQYLQGLVRCLIVLALQVAIDSVFYRKLVVVSLRVVIYNIFSGKDRGPDIFGTEPWHFYIRNLLLNFNLWFLLAVAVGPLLLIQAAVFNKSTTKQLTLRTFTLVCPFYLWFAIFTFQPHKEERFMFPAYPFLALNAAISAHILLSWIDSADTNTVIGRIPPELKTAMKLPLLFGSLSVGVLRIFGTVTAYRAPLQIYEALSESTTVHHGSNICLGKDWYRFPTSFFLPSNAHANFIKSEFDGLLPGEFLESNVLWYPGTWTVPQGMNDLNQEDMNKYTDIKQCSYLVDSWFPSTVSTSQEPDYITHPDWTVIKCEPFLDNGSTHPLARTIWIPDLPFLPAKYQRVWGKHCLFQRRR